MSRIVDGIGYSPLAALVNAVGFILVGLAGFAHIEGVAVPPWLGFSLFLIWIGGRQLAGWYEHRDEAASS